MNHVVLVGRLTKDPELRYIQGSGIPVATFTMAIDRDYKNKDGTTTTDFIPVEIMGKAAEFCASYINKGRLVGINGSIRVDRYETPSGEKRTFTKVAGRSIEALDRPAEKGSEGFNPVQAVGTPNFNATEDDDIPF